MKVPKFIEWLKTQDQGADVFVLVGKRAKAYEGDSYGFDEFVPEKHSEYVDMRGNKFAVGKPYENARTLYLGLGE